MKTKISIKKYTNWEYWPAFMFYVPNLPYAFYLAIKAKHPVFFSAANPGIKSSGNGTESKYETLNLVPEAYRPKSILVKPNTNINLVINLIKKREITYPLIAKPDVGFRGLLVKKIITEKELISYLNSYKINIIIQEFIDYKNECGIFYHRVPDSKNGHISSLTLKKFITVTGNGKFSLQELINNDERAKRYLSLFKETHKNNINAVPKKGEMVQLTEIGNHCKGTQFVNGNHLISKKLKNTFDDLNNSIEGWYYGRIDLKYDNFEDLENGKQFKVLEINGIIAEPTHIYDKENNSYYGALKTIRNHWKFLYEIATTNNKKNKTPYNNTLKFIKEIIALKKYSSFLKKI